MSYYESKHGFDALSDTNSKTDGIVTESKDKNVSVSQEILGKDWYLRKMEPNLSKQVY